MSRVRSAGGFAYVATIVFLIVLASLAAAAARLSTTEQATVDQAVLGARAGQAARAGIEWGLYQLRSQKCDISNNLTDFVSGSGFRVTVGCSSQTYNDGQKLDSGGNLVPFKKTLYTLTAIACNGSTTTCPDDGSAAARDYVERKRIAIVCIDDNGSDCY